MELSIFASPPNQVAIEKMIYTEERPISNLINDSTPEIVISGAGNDYIDLRKSRLYVKMQILKEDGTKLAPKEKAGIINLPLQSMFSNIDVYMNNKLISANSNNIRGSHTLKSFYLLAVMNKILNCKVNSS
ncbi:Hypothetical predicted protein [Mytilus galloprovincialis]|uniref:Uncharacterized protein n=1 Tax=Mytilus galloprovincialis TaxID=29158 RepID=A0A8B6BEL5_MYTGA|nr:Hypothetical predicted protein [Mytilus galloprovincialis]